MFKLEIERANIIFDHKQQIIPHFDFCVEKFNLILKILTCLLFGPYILEINFLISNFIFFTFYFLDVKRG